MATKAVKQIEIPTREEAIARLVELDVAKWGEGEREASQRARAKLSHGLALNTLAHYDPANTDKALAAAAKKMLTKADMRPLRDAARDR